GLALLVLIALVLVFGPLLALIPIAYVQFVVGVLLILFGMRWLRKAILRSSGYIALHDELGAFAKETDQLKRQNAERRADYLAGLAAFKAVLLEGVEVVFIVIALGSAHGLVGYASLGALAAVLVVGVAGAIVHKPLSQVPENSLKFVVGLLLTAFGIFWIGEGLGAEWPGADLAIIAILLVLVAFSVAAVLLLKSNRERAPS
ncbi:MAG: hypothetical protein KKF33_14770, partial [Alphaproteobacteria bacterium]|nr:hypothetical protein [Alphaproteobacteria bacterium]